jgi:hypothetical protein
MNTLPKDIYMEILLKLPLRDVLSLCLTGKRYNVMNNENFWRRKMVKDGYKDLFAQYLPKYKDRYKLAYEDHCLIEREISSYFTESLGNFSKYINIEKYKKDFIEAVYKFRENILTKHVLRNDYNYYEVPPIFYDMFPRSHFEGFGEFDDLYIFDNLITPLLHRELTHESSNENSDSDNSENEEDGGPILNIQEVEPGFFRDMERGFILTRFEDTFCVIKREENGIWRELTEEERIICGSLDLLVRLPHEQDREIEKVIVLIDGNELGVQYLYFEDITITLHRHFVIYKDTVAFKIAEGPIWRALTTQEKEIAISFGLKVL